MAKAEAKSKPVFALAGQTEGGIKRRNEISGFASEDRSELDVQSVSQEL